MMKFTKPALLLMALLGAIYMTPVAFAGATNTGDNTSATPGTNSSTTTTPEGHVVPDPGTPATRAVDTPSSGTGATAHDRSDTTKAGEMKSKSQKNCNPTTDRNCDQTRQNQNQTQTR